jgi:hypothetical protein
MEYFLTTLGIVLLACGFVGSVVPVLPGPLFGYAALWTLVPTDKAPSTGILALGAAIVVIVSIVDYVLPTFFAKKFKCSGWGVFGCAIGSLVGLFFLPIGLIAGPFLGTIAGELIAGRRFGHALKGGVGALVGYVATLAMKLVAVAYFAIVFIRAAFG